MSGVDHISLGAIKSKAAIGRMYRKLHLSPQSADEWIEDRRTGSLIGPFPGGRGSAMRDKLNRFVVRNDARLDGAQPFVLIDTNGVVVL